jgi:hypothetical protein
MSKFDNLPYAKWLEESLQNIVGKPIQSICIISKFDNGEVGTGYWNTTMGDKLLFAGVIQQDAMFDTMEANGLIADDETEEEEDENG